MHGSKAPKVKLNLLEQQDNGALESSGSVWARGLLEETKVLSVLGGS